MDHYAYLPLERVVFGRPAAQAAAEEVGRIGARRVFVVASQSLSRRTPVVREVRQALGRPATLREAGVQREQLAAVAAASTKNRWVLANPRPIRSEADVMRLLEAAW
ncbi:MAG TPA: hypothetical protein VJ789_03685 [Burkholderiales bacterium]|nr:hypothetical protein [Burkholderiales bacterium]